jgi:hypothetical protein
MTRTLRPLQLSIQSTVMLFASIDNTVTIRSEPEIKLKGRKWGPGFYVLTWTSRREVRLSARAGARFPEG